MFPHSTRPLAHLRVTSPDPSGVAGIPNIATFAFLGLHHYGDDHGAAFGTLVHELAGCPANIALQ